MCTKFKEREKREKDSVGFSETDELISMQAPYLDPSPHELLKRNHEQSGKLDVDRIWETTTGL